MNLLNMKVTHSLTVPVLCSSKRPFGVAAKFSKSSNKVSSNTILKNRNRYDPNKENKLSLLFQMRVKEHGWGLHKRFLSENKRYILLIPAIHFCSGNFYSVLATLSNLPSGYN